MGANITPQIETKRPFVIRDPVHGYLVVAMHERLLVDDPVTQRLRRITQTGLAEYVFPEARTSRFVHSLGAMHMASRFVLAALENADEEVAKEFFDDIESRVPKFSGARDSHEELLHQHGTLSALATLRASFRHKSLRTPRVIELMAIVEAGLRLAALFHDLGHLPFSHDVEYALQDYAAQQKSAGNELPEGLMSFADADAPHEAIGHTLADILFQANSKKTSAATRAAFEMSTSILNATIPKYDLRRRPHASPLQWLHSLVDGEIDADRADYLLRDGQALGLDFAHYDVDRLVSNLVLVRDPDLGYVTAVKEPGLAALESYCLSRSRSSQIFIRHHKVAQIAASLRHASVRAFAHQASAPFKNALISLAEGHDGNLPDVLNRFARFDDYWWAQVLRELQSDKTTDALTKACTDLVLDRGRTLKSVWKRKGDLTDDQVRNLNDKTDNLFASTDGPIALADKRRELLRKGILINPFKFKPFVRRDPDNESVMLVTGEKGSRPASLASPLIANLKNVWEQDIHLYAFVERSSGMTLDDVISAVLSE
jgi:HD superfamily phosphohydrolase